MSTNWKDLRAQIKAAVDLRDVAEPTGQKVTRSGKALKMLCPLHGDTNPSLHVYADGFKCFACGEHGDIFDWYEKMEKMTSQEALREAAVRARVSLPGGRADPKASRSAPDTRGVTLEELAEAKQLPVDFLSSLGWKTTRREGRPAIRIPYQGKMGEDAPIRYRIALSGDDRFRWAKGASPCLYGAARYRDGPPDESVLVEGETDTVTGWFHDLDTLGIPGANNWREERDAPLLDGAGIIYIVIEPDAGGEAVQSWLSRSRLRDRARLVDLTPFGVKDLSALHCADPKRFLERWEEAKAAAVPFAQIEQQGQDDRAAAAWELAAPLLNDPLLFDRIVQLVQAGGYAGDTAPVMLAYLALTSRLLDRPNNLAFVGPSAAGKNQAVEEALALMPQTAYYKVAAASPRALIYSQESFRHRIVVFAEADSIATDDGSAASAMRSIVADGQMCYAVVERDQNGHFVTREIVKEGPTGLITTSTRSLPHQLGTRTLEVPIPDDAKQTKEIMLAHARRFAGSQPARPDVSAFVALQTWLELAGYRAVVVPFAEALALMVPDGQVRLRRDFSQLLTCIASLALLYQCQRERDDLGRVVATLDDYRRAHKLLAPIFTAIDGDGITPAVRATVEEVKEGETVTEVQLAQRLGLPRSTVGYRVKRALAGGWLVDGEERTGRGVPRQLRRGAPLPEAKAALPDPDELSPVPPDDEQGDSASRSASFSASENGVPTPEIDQDAEMTNEIRGEEEPVSESAESDPRAELDPRREDFAEDSTHWTKLLDRAFALAGDDPEGIFGTLRGLRALGARLSVAPDGTVKLLRGEIDPDAYQEIRAQYLMPRASLLVSLLGQITSPVEVEWAAS